MRSFFLLVPLGLALVLSSCATNDAQPPIPAINTPVDANTAPPASTSNMPPASAAPYTGGTAGQSALADLRLELEPIANGFERPLYITSAGDNSERLFVVEQQGVIQIVQNGQRLAQPFLDIRDLVGSRGNEQGLLSVAFHPDYQRNGQFFVNYTNRDGNTIIARYQVSDNPDSADLSSAQIILTINQPASNHNGGLLKFGPDGYFYVGMGDGGRAGDPWNNAQNRAVLLGKLLRIDVSQVAPYSAPADNPFVGQAEARPEIWAYGLRNPWRFSFDRATGDLYIADVGQNVYEEVHFQPAGSQGGENYGWNIMEGNECYPSDNACDRSGLELPIAAYSHREGGCSITGGYVYRGNVFPQMAGLYFYADYCSGYLWGLQHTNGAWQSELLLRTNAQVSSFGEDDAGELYLTDLGSGTVYRLVHAS
ncbi:MAG: PQQ-dependent sugar dehydrogenase [Chloroflexales bacterium]|nr:PQQ-dependent sugar dehydrogenase [Chloroflexales bacterium]